MPDPAALVQQIIPELNVQGGGENISYAYTEEGKASFIDPDTGQQTWVPVEQAQDAANMGLIPESSEQYQQRMNAEIYDAPVQTALLSGLSSLTFGLPDLMLGENELYRREREAYEKYNPTAAAIGDIGGSLLSAFIPGGPIGRMGAMGAKAGESLAAKIAAQKLGQRLLPAVGRAVGEGAAMGALGEVTSQAREMSFDPVEIAKQAAVGSAIGGALSLAGAGLSKVGGKAKKWIYERAGVNEKKLKSLVGAQKKLKSDLRKYKDIKINKDLDNLFKERSQVKKQFDEAIDRMEDIYVIDDIEARLNALDEKLSIESERVGLNPKKILEYKDKAEKLARVEEVLSETRRKIFNVSAFPMAMLRRNPRYFGLAVGFSAESIALGIAGAAASKVLTSDLAIKGYAAAARATMTLAGEPAGKIARLGAIDILTRKELSEIEDDLSDQDPSQIFQDAFEGYASSGLDEQFAHELAGIQTARTEIVREAVASGDRIKASKVVDALQDPRRIIARVQEGKASREDVLVLRRAFPQTYSEMQEAATEILRQYDDELSAKKRDQLKMISEPDVNPTAVILQSIFDAGQEPAPKPQPKGRTFESSTTMQRIARNYYG